MGVIAIIAALLIEQWRPLGDRKSVNEARGAWAGWLEQSFNGGERRHGIVAWLVAVIPAAAGGAVLHALFYALHPLLALAFNIAALYVTLGFRQFSHHFTAIQLALKAGEIERARLLLDEWRGASGVVRTREEVIRLAIEEALLASHRHVFGVLLWYVLLPGPSGAILYRLAAFLAARWQGLGAFGRFAQQAFYVLDWPAVRLTAAAFAVVGDFEDAVYCWRTQAPGWPDPNAGVVIAGGAGAMGVSLRPTVLKAVGMNPCSGLGIGATADASFISSTVVRGCA